MNRFETIGKIVIDTTDPTDFIYIARMLNPRFGDLLQEKFDEYERELAHENNI